MILMFKTTVVNPFHDKNGEKWWSLDKKKKYKYEEEDDDDNALVDKRWVPLKWKVDKTLFTFSYKCLLKANTSCHMMVMKQKQHEL